MPDPSADLAAAESLYLDARDLRDRLEVSLARGEAEPGLAELAWSAAVRARRALRALDAGRSVPQDARALDVMGRWLDEAVGERAGSPGPEPPAGPAMDGHGPGGTGFAALARQIMDAYAAAQGAVEFDGQRLTRLAVLGRLGDEHDAATRRRLFLALEPVWRSIAGDGGVGTSPYRELVGLSAQRWAAGRSPVAANARALGMDPQTIEPGLVAILEAWRRTAVTGPVEPWDWWYAAGAAGRALRDAVPPGRLLPVTRAYHAALCADLERLGVGFDVVPRPGRPPVPVAYTTFGSRPRQGPGGRWLRARPWVFAAYTAGGLGELTELVHETGHALHVAAIATRPAFADWPDSDALTEALAELLALDTAEPAWQAHWLGTAAPEEDCLRGRYAEVMLDICWALFEIRMHARPGRDPDELWAELTSTYLGIAAHPQWPWWAMRGQLIDEPGYMSNYAIGPILAADLRAAIRAVRGPWITGDTGWYAWVSGQVYRWGLARSSGELLRSVLGRAPSLDPLLAEISRAG